MDPLPDIRVKQNAVVPKEEDGNDDTGNEDASLLVKENHEEQDKGILIESSSMDFCDYLLMVWGFLWLIVFFPFCFTVVKDYEKIVVFRNGKSRFGKEGGPPGVYLIWPCIDTHVVIDMRTKTLNIPKQGILTKDSLSITIDAVVYVHIHDPVRSVYNVEDWENSVLILASTTIRNVLGTRDLSQIMRHRQEIGLEMSKLIDVATDKWGLTVERVELTELILPKSLERAMAAEAEAKREASAKVIGAKGEEEAAAALRDASDKMSAGALQLRFFQTLHSISAEKNSTIILPFPVDMFQNNK